MSSDSTALRRQIAAQAQPSLSRYFTPKSAEFLDALEQVLTTEHGAVVTRHFKPTFTAPAPKQLIDEVAASCDAVIDALAD